MKEHSQETKKQVNRTAVTLAAGAVLGALSTLLGYGAAGGLILTILGGSLWLLFRLGHPRNPWVLSYCALAVSSFYIFGYRMISDLESLQIIMMLGAFVVVPWLIAVAVDASYQAWCNSKRKAEQGVDPNA